MISQILLKDDGSFSMTPISKFLLYHIFSSVNGKYAPQGKLGAAVLGHVETKDVSYFVVLIF